MTQHPEDRNDIAGTSRLVRPRGERGFTLLELAVTMTILGVLVGLASPAYGGVRRRVDDRVAQATLRSTLTGARSLAVHRGNFGGVDLSALDTEVGGRATMLAEDVVSADPSQVSVGVSPDLGTLYLASWSRAGKCFLVRDVLVDGQGGTAFTSTAGSCSAETAAMLADPSWRVAW